jgi:hypothetical protein
LLKLPVGTQVVTLTGIPSGGSGRPRLRDGAILVRVDKHREALMAIRRGELRWEEVDAWRLALHREFDAAFATTRLPERPDYAQANAFLIHARRSVV